jgi:hypothetical protein
MVKIKKTFQYSGHVLPGMLHVFHVNFYHPNVGKKVVEFFLELRTATRLG